MNTRLTALATLALTTFALLGTACDPETTGDSVDEATFRGDTFIPPTKPIGGSIVVGGGHDNPLELILRGYDRAPLELQIAFQAKVEADLIKSFQQAFLADERTYEECPWVCEEQHMSWDEGVYVSDLRFEMGAVRVAESPAGLFWETEASGEAQVGCGCTF
jgi:hypothetical protein